MEFVACSVKKNLKKISISLSLIDCWLKLIQHTEIGGALPSNGFDFFAGPCVLSFGTKRFRESVVLNRFSVSSVFVSQLGNT